MKLYALLQHNCRATRDYIKFHIGILRNSKFVSMHLETDAVPCIDFTGLITFPPILH